MKRQMLTYRPILLELEDSHLILLPKLVPDQVQVLQTRLSSTSFRLYNNRSMRRGAQVVRVHSDGYFESREDAIDMIGPVIPRLLGVPKSEIGLEELESMYFHISNSAGRSTLRFTPRVERGRLWKDLRSSGQCGLTPDEHLIMTMILGASSGRCSMLTDFPTEDSRVKLFGRRQFYLSTLQTVEAAQTLSFAGRKSARNTYIPESGLIVLEGLRFPNPDTWLDAFNRLGEWCYWMPKLQKL